MRRSIFTADYLYSLVELLALHVGPYLLLSVISVYAMSLTGSNSLAGAMISAFPLAGLAGRFLAARLLGRLGAKRVTVASTSLLAIASACYLVQESYPVALALRAVQGLGYSVAVTALSTHIVDILRPEDRLEGIGYSSLTNTLCSVFGPTIAFSLLGPDVDRFFLLFGCVLGASVVALVMAVFSKDAPQATTSDQTSTTSGGVGPIAWKAALLPVALLAAVSFSQSAPSSFLTLHALERGFTGIGAYFTLNALGIFASRFVMARIVDALGDRMTVTGSILIIAASTLGIALARSIGVLYAIAVPFGFAVGLLQPIINAHLVAMLGEGRSGTANALFYAAGDVGFITGPVVWGALAQATSYQLMFTVSAVVLVACAIAAPATGLEGKRRAA